MLARAVEAGVNQIVTAGTKCKNRAKKAVALAQKYPQIFAAVGIHPQEIAGHAEKRYQADCGAG